MSERITKEQYLQLQGLNVLRNKNTNEREALEKAIAQITNVEVDEYGYHGFLSDWWWDESGVDKLLAQLEIEVE